MELCFPSAIFAMLLFSHFLQLRNFAYANDEKYEECNKPYQCGDVSLSYPFYDSVNRPLNCGYPGFEIECNDGMISFTMSSEIYHLASMDTTSHTISVAKHSYWETSCPQNLFNTSINFSLYKYTSADQNFTLFYDCPSEAVLSANEFSCNNRSSNGTVYYFMNKNLESSKAFDKCQSRVLVPILQSRYESIANSSSLISALRYGFGLEWIAENDLCDGCRGSGGECGYDSSTNKFTCFCPDQPYDSRCSSHSKGSVSHKVHKIAGVILACITVGLGMLALLACYLKRRFATENQDINAFLKKYGPLPTKRYTYRSLKKVTNSFKDKLGEGGYGIVYKGKLPNGHLVAVKLLKESKENAEEFINEVTSIGKTNHVNVVTLLGFCFEGQRRALVYDFMPNGSLEKFIYGKSNYQLLIWDELFQIAVGIARGLEYLHRGCNTRIVHFDIKPHNILLDENFCPKISDFGLAKPFQKNNSIIPMSGARGTVGFIAPEVYLSSLGRVSHKSDVYSYGMLVLDMVGCRKNMNPMVENSSEQYSLQWTYKQLEQTEEFDHQDLLNKDEKETLRKMILVSLWCIQIDPSKRPPMTRVVEMLEGALESLPIPPKPYLFPPPISQPTSSSKATFSI